MCVQLIGSTLDQSVVCSIVNQIYSAPFCNNGVLVQDMREQDAKFGE